MVVKKSYILISALLFALCVNNVRAENNLVQLDLKRASDSSVDVTLVTSGNYSDNVLVRKKSDNKYVILIPKVQSSGYRASNLAGVNDLVQNIDVKTVEDTSGGYTKVTLVTTKPLDIKTRTTKTAPVSVEQNEYNTLISQANSIRNTISNHEPPKIREQKTEVTVSKAPKETKPKVAETPKTKTETVKKPEIKLKEIAPEKIESYNRKAHLAELKNEINMEKSLEEVPDTVPDISPVVNESVKDISEIPPISETSSKTGIFAKIKKGIHKIPSKLPKAAGVMLLAIVAITMISKLGRRTSDIANNYPINDVPQPDLNIHENYDNIVNDNGLSWKEKYRLYLDKSAKPVARANNKGNYSFIKKPFVSVVDKKRVELEKMLDEVKINDFGEIEKFEPEMIESEDRAINKTIKLKAFSHGTNSLKMTRRDRSRFKKYENELPLHEQRTIQLDETPLNMNRRSLADGNLKVSDVDRRKITYEPKEYIMSSVDEFFDLLDDKPKTEVYKPEIPKKVVSNPISKANNEYFKGTIVKSSYKIGQDKGIYLVNKNGKNSLVGKVNDKVFVLKKFDGNITNPIQVRHDNANVYMVKAGGFKSLVEVNEEKMGVLIEL